MLQVQDSTPMRIWTECRSLPRAVWVLCFVTLINRAGTMVLPFLVLYLTDDVRMTPATAGSIVLVYGVGSVVTAPLAGKWTDRIGARRMMQGSLFASGALLFVFPFTRSLPGIAALTFVWAVASEAFRPANMAVIGDLVPTEQRKMAFALVRFAINLGMSVGPAAGGFLAAVSFNWLFLIDGATSVLAGVALTIWFAMPATTHPAATTTPVAASRWGALADRRMATFAVGTFLVGVLFTQELAAVPLYIVRNLGFSEKVFGLTMAINTVLIVFFEIPLNVATTHWPHKRALLLGTLLTTLGMGGFAFSTTAWSIAAVVAVWTFGEMILLPSMSALVSDLAPNERRGEYMGLFQLAWSGSFLAGPWLGTIVLDRFGSTTLWYGCFGVGALAALVFWTSASKEDQAA